MTTSSGISSLEERVVERINSYLIERKSSEILDGERRVPITTNLEVRIIANKFLKDKNVKIPQDVLDLFLASSAIDLKMVDETTGWDMFWAQEMAAAMVAIAHGGGKYQSYLPGRFLHYDLLAYNLASLFNGSKQNSINGKNILELGSGSGLGLMRLAQKGATVTGLDSSIMAIEFSKYLANHYGVSDKVVELRQADYFEVPYGESMFDMTYNSGVFEHLEDKKPSKLLDEMIRVTRPRGYIVISVPNKASPFYQYFKQREMDTKTSFPNVLGVPVEHKRYDTDIRKLMDDKGLRFVKQEGILVAPSSPIEHVDFSGADLEIFDSYLPKESPATVEARIAAWRGLEVMANSIFRIKYGWSTVYIAQKRAK